MTPTFVSCGGRRARRRGVKLARSVRRRGSKLARARRLRLG